MELFRAEKGNFDKAVEKAAKIIRKGKVAVMPTDTVYGLITDPTNKKAIEKLFKIKKRRNEKPVPIFVKDIKTAKTLASLNKEKEKIVRKSWPGKMTAIFQRKKGHKLYGVDKKTIGLRIPDYKLINILLEKLNRPLTGTSANISGKPASTKIKEVINQFKKQKCQPNLIIDAGNLPKNRPSKVIDLTGEKVKILRN